MKKEILSICKKLQLDTINSLKSAVDEAQKSANEYGPPKDRYDSFRTQLLRKRDMYAQQLAKANQQMELLNRIDPDKVCTEIEFGALVLTNIQNMFISIGLGKVQAGDETFYAISPAVPVFRAMEGKKEGETFSFNNISFTIKRIL
jgi:hypothetical protein